MYGLLECLVRLDVLEISTKLLEALTLIGFDEAVPIRRLETAKIVICGDLQSPEEGRERCISVCESISHRKLGSCWQERLKIFERGDEEF